VDIVLDVRRPHASSFWCTGAQGLRFDVRVRPTIAPCTQLFQVHRRPVGRPARWGAQRHCGRRLWFHGEGGECTPEARLLHILCVKSQKNPPRRHHWCCSVKLQVTAATVTRCAPANRGSNMMTILRCSQRRSHDGSCPRRQLAGWLAALLICLAYSSAARWTSVVVWCWQLLGSACGVPRGGSVPQQARRFCTLTMLHDSFQVVCCSWHVRWLLLLLGCFPPPGSEALATGNSLACLVRLCGCSCALLFRCRLLVVLHGTLVPRGAGTVALAVFFDAVPRAFGRISAGQN
jgi:hypothetical protein